MVLASLIKHKGQTIGGQIGLKSEACLLMLTVTSACYRLGSMQGVGICFPCCVTPHCSFISSYARLKGNYIMNQCFTLKTLFEITHNCWKWKLGSCSGYVSPSLSDSDRVVVRIYPTISEAQENI